MRVFNDEILKGTRGGDDFSMMTFFKSFFYLPVTVLASFLAISDVTPLLHVIVVRDVFILYDQDLLLVLL